MQKIIIYQNDKTIFIMFIVSENNFIYGLQKIFLYSKKISSSRIKIKSSIIIGNIENG
jgi:hypothetical protein